ncbi:YqgE/AlgH family protein [Acidobacteria bacterium AH-259-O06]|nr:YqgE/AlgH family protein [Acidobacteria bacterium AH-259-O06]
MYRQHRCLAFLAFALLLVPPTASGGAGSASVRKQSQRLPNKTVVPEKGIFLVASPGMEDPRFRRTVILLLAHGQGGTMGLIINRATDIPLSHMLPELKTPGKDSHMLFFGGPVALNGLIFLTRSVKPPKGASHVMGDVYFSGDRKVLEKLLQGNKRTNELRLYLGHSGWAPGQLTSEIAHGGWQLVRADAHTVFEKDLDSIWRDLIERPLPRTLVARRPMQQRAQGAFW